MTQTLMLQVFEMTDSYLCDILKRNGGRISPPERIELFNMLSEHYGDLADKLEAELASKAKK